MNKIIITTITLLLSIILSATAWSYTIDFGDIDSLGNPVYKEVGALDILLKTATLASSSDQAELNWVKDEFGWADTEITWKYKVNQSEDWTVTRENSTYFAHDLGSTTDYYLLKIGTGSLPSGTPSHYLFQNSDALEWAVIDVTLFGSGKNVNIGRVSHVTQFNSGGADPVPEPDTLFLLGFGLLGIAAVGRKKQLRSIKMPEPPCRHHFPVPGNPSPGGRACQRTGK